MESSNLKIGWTVNKQYGYISDVEWAPYDDKHIQIQHFKQERGIRCATELISTEYCEDEPYENNDAWVFTNESQMHDWLRNESVAITSKLQHYLERLSVHDSKAVFILNSVWPENFVLGHLPSNYRNYTRVYVSNRKISEYSVDYVIAYAEKQLGMPLAQFSRIWLKMEYGRYANELAITLAVDSSEQRAYFNTSSPPESKVRTAVDYVMKSKCPSLKYNLEVYRTPRYMFGDDKYLVDLSSSYLDNALFAALGSNLKTKLSSAMRQKDAPTTNVCAYLVSDDMLDLIPAHIINSSIPMSYTYITHKCYAVRAPINIKVWARPDNQIIVDTHIPVGSASLVKFNDKISSKNILDQLLEMSE